MMRKLRRIISRMLNDQPKLKSWMRPMETIQPRLATLDMAIANIHISTRFERRSLDGDRERAMVAPDSLLGDYAEFGVYQGRTFAHACHRAGPLMPWMRFFAFDSFEGLPPPVGHDAVGEFEAGQFSCSRADFEGYLRSNEVDMSRVVAVPGWFDQTLTPEAKQQHQLRIVSIAYIDCDLYESCVPVLSFLTDLVRQGSILMFDDWFAFKGQPDKGVQRATSEWLAANPQIRLAPWQPFSHHGLGFVVSLNEQGQAAP